MLCKGNLVAAKELLEVVLDELEMKVVVNSHESKHILPPYLVSILVYLILKTSKFTTLEPSDLNNILFLRRASLLLDLLLIIEINKF